MNRLVAYLRILLISGCISFVWIMFEIISIRKPKKILSVTDGI